MDNTAVSSDIKIQHIMDNTTCKKHHAERSVPCWFVLPGEANVNFLSGICGPRVRKLGFSGAISPESLQVKSIRRFKKN
jgi:hypothetical protein